MEEEEKQIQEERPGSGLGSRQTACGAGKTPYLFGIDNYWQLPV